MGVLLLHIVVALLWAWIAQWPWGMYLFEAVIAIGVAHLVSPVWFHFVGPRPFHRAFLCGPLVLAGIDAAFLLYAWTNDLWSDLTVVFVPVLAACGAIALLYALLVMSLLDGWRTRREKRAKER
jgi:hypothetical protein